MNFKQRVTKTIDIVLYTCFAIVFAIAAVGVMSGQVGTALIFLAVGWIVLCVLSGTWFVLSSISDNAHKQTEIMEKILKEMRGV